MPDTITIEEAKFTERIVNGKYRVKMPEFLAAHDCWDNWERERFESMEANLKKGDVLFDVGAETGAISAIYAQFVGAENLVLFEPNPSNWQNIYATWQAENLPNPLAMRCALVSNRNSGNADFDTGAINGWPIVALTGNIWTPRSFRYIHEHADKTPQLSLDAFVAMTGIIPKAITIDVEGAEMRVLLGAEASLMAHHPLVWVSIHEDLLRRDYGTEPIEVCDFMEKCGYRGEHLAVDHESHWLYRPCTSFT